MVRWMFLFGKCRAYLALTKPTILLLVLITGAAGLVFEGSLIAHPARFALALLLLAMSGGSANAFNQYFERDIDAAMARTRMRRSLPWRSHRPDPRQVAVADTDSGYGGGCARGGSAYRAIRTATGRYDRLGRASGRV